MDRWVLFATWEIRWCGNQSRCGQDVLKGCEEARQPGHRQERCGNSEANERIRLCGRVEFQIVQGKAIALVCGWKRLQWGDKDSVDVGVDGDVVVVAIVVAIVVAVVVVVVIVVVAFLGVDEM